MRHIRNRLTNKNFYILFGLDAVFVFVSILGSILLRYEFIFPIELYQFFQPVHIILILLIKLGSFSYFGLYRGMWRYTSIWDMINVIKANILASGLCITLIWFTLGFKGISKSIFVLDFMIFSFLAGSSRLGVRIYFNHILKSLRITKKSRSIRKVIIIGAGDTGQAILRQSLEQPEERIKVVGFLDNNPSKIGSSLHDIPVLGPIDSLVNHTGLFDEILICIPSASRKEMRNIIEICKQSGKLFKTLPSITELVQGRFTISEFKEVSLVDLLGREEVNLDKNSINELIHGKRVLITGAGGSIGSELVRQCLKYEPAVLVMLDLSEYNLFEIDREIMALDFSSVLFKPVLCDIRDKDVLAQVFDEFEPQVVLHAAAYKHVPMQETFPWEAVKTNVLGTANLTHIALKHMVEKFVLVSTDKAVKPVNVMGATKRLAELIVQSANTPESQFIAVRFGNVLGSSGSVIPIFQEQIRNGGPVTVTDPDMQRYFMSVSEASQLILQAGALGEGGGEVFVLDMGEPLRILDIANELIRLSGYEPELDIPINFIGPRPGEKKVEELVLDNEMLNDTRHDKIFVLKENIATPEVIDFIKTGIYELELDISQNSASQIRRKLSLILPEYDPDLGAGEPIYLNIKAKAQA